MSLTPERMDKKLDEHFAFEAADDVEGVLSTLSHDATHDIAAHDAPPGVDCTHMRAGTRRCGIYSDRPGGCAGFTCLWLQGSFSRSQSPDRIGIVLQERAIAEERLDGLELQ